MLIVGARTPSDSYTASHNSRKGGGNVAEGEGNVAMFLISWLEHQLLKTVGKVLAVPVTVPIKSASWLLEQIHGEAEAEQLNEDRVRQQLMELEIRYEAEEIGKEEFQAQEEELLERLNAIRERKKDEQFEKDETWWRRVFSEGFK